MSADRWLSCIFLVPHHEGRLVASGSTILRSMGAIASVPPWLTNSSQIAMP